MKFVNVKLTKEQKEAIAARKILNPYGGFENMMDGINPSYLTIDEETDTWLAWTYFDHEADENVEAFIFMYKQCPIPVQVIREYTKETGTHWKVTRINIPDNLLPEKEVIKDLIISAFLVYNSSGWPEDCEPSAKTRCSFAEGGVMTGQN